MDIEKCVNKGMIKTFLVFLPTVGSSVFLLPTFHKKNSWVQSTVFVEFRQ